MAILFQSHQPLQRIPSTNQTSSKPILKHAERQRPRRVPRNRLLRPSDSPREGPQVRRRQDPRRSPQHRRQQGYRQGLARYRRLDRAKGLAGGIAGEGGEGGAERDS